MAGRSALRVDPPCGANVLEAVPAVDRLAGCGAERDLGHLTARRADRLVEFAWPAPGDRRWSHRTPRLALLLVAAATAAGRLVLKAPILVETLLAHREDELFAAVA